MPREERLWEWQPPAGVVENKRSGGPRLAVSVDEDDVHLIGAVTAVSTGGPIAVERAGRTHVRRPTEDRRPVDRRGRKPIPRNVVVRGLRLRCARGQRR